MFSNGGFFPGPWPSSGPSRRPFHPPDLRPLRCCAWRCQNPIPPRPGANVKEDPQGGGWRGTYGYLVLMWVFSHWPRGGELYHVSVYFEEIHCLSKIRFENLELGCYVTIIHFRWRSLLESRRQYWCLSTLAMNPCFFWTFRKIQK